jgi:hypothetical protein
MHTGARVSCVVAAGGILALAFLFDDASGLWGHDPVAFATPIHLIGLASLALSLWPTAADAGSAWRRQRAAWAFVGPGPVAAFLGARGPMAAAVASLVWSAGSLLVVVWRTRPRTTEATGRLPDAGGDRHV